MPVLRVETNVSKADFDVDTLSKDLLRALAKSLGKPEQYCMVAVRPDTHLIMGSGDGAKKPVVFASLMSIGQLGVNENKKHASVLYPILKQHLGVDGSRAYVHFIDAPSSAVGFQGSTFHDLLG